MQTYLDFEKSVADLEGKVRELRILAEQDGALDIEDEASKLTSKAQSTLGLLYSSLSPWQKCQVARHPERPHTSDYIKGLISDFTPLAGDRGFGEDHAVLSGLGRLKGRPVMILGQEKGFDTPSRLKHNFGMARPEGYRKAIRLMDMADRFGLPVVTFIDTPGAYPGKGAEERGQSEAIARCTDKCLQLGVPLVTVVIGEGGSGGAVAFATANRVMMLEHAIYSVISPEGGASILWKDSDKAKQAAAALRLTAQDLHKLGVIDDIIEEPVGGAHRAGGVAIEHVGEAIHAALEDLSTMNAQALRHHRRQKFLDIGKYKL